MMAMFSIHGGTWGNLETIQIVSLNTFNKQRILNLYTMNIEIMKYKNNTKLHYFIWILYCMLLLYISLCVFVMCIIMSHYAYLLYDIVIYFVFSIYYILIVS